MTESKSTETVAFALVEAQGEIHGMGKDSTNQFHKYQYVSAEAVVLEARKALQKAKLSVCREYEVHHNENHVLLHSVFYITHEKGDTLVKKSTWFIIEGNGRPLDKALAGALTSSLAYFLRDLLLIPKQEEADSLDKRDDTKHVEALKNALGVGGAVKLRKKLRSAGLELDALVNAMGQSGVAVPEELQYWDTAWLPRIDAWIKKKTSEAVALMAKPEEEEPEESED